MTKPIDSKMITAEFHCHSAYSSDCQTDIAGLIEYARELGLDRLAITDHNTIAGALLAKELAPDLIIVGEEVQTARGELIGYFIKDEIPRGLSVRETLRRLKDQGAFISVPHPFDLMRHGWRQSELLELLPDVDALEVFNARCLRESYNDQALAFARQNRTSMLAGSDAHALGEIGLALTHLPEFRTADDLRIAVKDTVIDGSILSKLDHLKTSLKTGWSKLAGRK